MPDGIHHHVEVKRIIQARSNIERMNWDGYYKFQAVCGNCSWFSQVHSTKRDATQDGDEHSIAMAGER